MPLRQSLSRWPFFFNNQYFNTQSVIKREGKICYCPLTSDTDASILFINKWFGPNSKKKKNSNKYSKNHLRFLYPRGFGWILSIKLRGGFPKCFQPTWYYKHYLIVYILFLKIHKKLVLVLMYCFYFYFQ